jgi:glycosyltransferase involved in cell wall biosynthesis
MRHSGITEALSRMQTDLGYGRSDPSGLMHYATAAEELRDFAAADSAIDRLLAATGATENHLHDAARLYFRRGHILRADEISRMALARFPLSQRLRRLSLIIERQIARTISVFPELVHSDQHFTTALFLRLIEEFSLGRQNLRKLPKGFLGSVIMVGATLAPGGAERQLVNTALGLQQAITYRNPIAGVYIDGPLHVICRSLAASDRLQFHLHELETAEIPVSQFSTFADFGGDWKHSCLGRYRHLLSYLPRDIAEATRKLADALHVLSPDVVHIWQDGAIVVSYLAAVAARVPRIVLGLRTLPPSDRPGRHRAEYAELYKVAAKTPGVRFVTNTPVIARRYSHWLNIDPKIFHIVPNAVVQFEFAETPIITAEQKNFIRQPEDRRFTVGGIMRFDANKRPLLWAEMALDVLELRSEARFILIGDGPLLKATQDFIALSGREYAFLFLGRTANVPFWLNQMDVVVSLSHQEGVPNNLIEAQMAGIPVVATPAGGSEETFEDGFTGTLLPSAVDVDSMEVARAVCRWQLTPERRAEVSEHAKQRAIVNFGVQRMLEATIDAYVG